MQLGMRKGPVWQRKLWKTSAARANDQDVWWEGADGWQSLAAVKGNRETLLLSVINNILLLWCSSSSSHQRCAALFQELPKLSGPPWGAHRRVRWAFIAPLSLGTGLGAGQDLHSVSCLQRSWVVSQDGSMGCWFLGFDYCFGPLRSCVHHLNPEMLPKEKLNLQFSEFTGGRRRETVAGQRQIESIWG